MEENLISLKYVEMPTTDIYFHILLYLAAYIVLRWQRMTVKFELVELA